MAPAIVLLHGFTNTGRSWDPVIRALGERYRAVAPDLRGHGTASALVPVNLAGVVADVTQCVRGPFVLAGYSMGGRIALHVALELPSRVQGLLLIGASPGIADPEERAARRAADKRLAGEVERLSIEAFADRWAASPVLAGQPAEVQERVREDRLRNTPAGLARALRGLGTGALPSLWGRLGELAMPVRVVAGENDEKFTAIAVQMADLIPDARIEIVPGAGHAVHLEAPETIAQLIRAGAFDG